MDFNEDFLKAIEERVIRGKDSRYRLDAYIFVIRSLDFLLERIVSETNQKRHVTGQELSLAVRDYAIERYGPTAKMVLEHWGLSTTADIGHIVYNLIDIGLMGRTDTDQLEDFCGVYDFEEEFVRKFRFSSGYLRA